MISCPDCKKMVSESAETCPKCGFRFSPETIKKAKEKQKKAQKNCLIIFILIIASIFSSYLIKNFLLESSNLKYTLYNEQSKNGLYSSIIIVDPINSNEEFLKQLGEKLKIETQQYTHVYVNIYDNLKSAEMDKKVMDLSEEEYLYFKEHHIASYTKNLSSNFHEFVIMLDEKTLQIKY